MRLVRTCCCLLLCATAALSTSSAEEPAPSSGQSQTIDEPSTTPASLAEVPLESIVVASTSIASAQSTTDVSSEVETATEGISSSLASPTPSSSAVEPTMTSVESEALPPTPSEPPPAPSTHSPSPLSSPPSSELLPTSSPSLSIPPLPSISIVSEVPLTSIPPVPEFLSFNEWKEKYVVVPDPSIALARRAKKAAQRQRQDVVGAGSVGEKGAAYDGDGADLGSLFASGEDPAEASTNTKQGRGTKSEEGKSRRTKNDRVPTVQDPERPSTSSLSPIQPLPNVGTGDENDPLLPLKDRSNYAAFECAAMVHRSSRKTKGASAILVEKKDRYMLTPCAADPKFVEVELCDEIQIDTIVLANFEFFSSMFKQFKASCSVNYPGNVEDWHDLGTFRARNVRGVQVFRPNLIPNFCRYIRINFLSHFGSEYYCPVSLLRVYGYTQLDAYRESERKARQLQEALAAAEEYVDDEVEDDLEDIEEGNSLPVKETSVPDQLESAEPSTRVDQKVESEEVLSDSKKFTEEIHIHATSERPAVHETTPAPYEPLSASPSPEPSAESTVASTTLGSPLSSQTASPNDASPSSTITANDSATGLPETSTVESSRDLASEASSTLSPSQTSKPSSQPTSHAAGLSPPTVSLSPTSVPLQMQTNTSNPLPSSSVYSRPAAPSDLPIINPRPVVLRNDTPSVHPYAPPHRAPVISPPPQQPQPGESIYATIMKRLTSLEHNQTLSMHFIEAQSSMLREAFTRVERRLGEVEATRSRQEQGIRQALLELEKERSDLERERLGLSTQVGMLAQEIRFEKRLGAAQLIGTLLLLIFVGFTRSIPTSPFLHLASSAQSQGRTPSKRDSDYIEEPQPSAEEKSSPDLSRKPLGRRSSGNGGAKSGHSKRYPSMSKPGPRRHYGTGTSSSARTPAFAKSPRAWTPPLRHSSAPPEEPFNAATSTALEGKEPRRRHVSNRRPGSPFEFPRRSKLESQLGLAIDPILSREERTASPASLADQSSSFLRSSRHFSSASANDAPLQFRTEVVDSQMYVESSTTNGDQDHYATTDDEDDPPLSPLPSSQLPPPLVSPLPSTPSQSTAGHRPPKPTLPSRPSTSMGIPFPNQTLSSRSSSDFRRTSHRNNPPTPPSTVPTPPPEPAVVVQDEALVK
ncbi:hypothetical protein JCM16303_006096 [Sporobolomyces ruberrimus]